MNFYLKNRENLIEDKNILKDLLEKYAMKNLNNLKIIIWKLINR